MRNTREPGSVRIAGSGYPLLMECDRHGHVLWMSDQARSMLGAIDSLSAVILIISAPSPDGSVPTACLVRLLEQGDRVLISIDHSHSEEIVEYQEIVGLLIIQSSLLSHYFRLLNAERSLSSRVYRKRRGSGRQSVFQVERERQRLGRELHTGVGQMLAAIRLQLEIISTQRPAYPGPVQQALTRISTLATEALEQVRSVSRRLHPPEWQRLTLETALHQLWEMSGVPETFHATLAIDHLPHDPSLEVKVLLYRAAQEALSNLTRHSRATHVQMSLHLDRERLVLSIQDDGVGFDVPRHLSAPASVTSGIGLRTIREQADAIGAKLILESSPVGTKLEVSALLTSEKS